MQKEQSCSAMLSSTSSLQLQGCCGLGGVLAVFELLTHFAGCLGEWCFPRNVFFPVWLGRL